MWWPHFSDAALSLKAIFWIIRALIHYSGSGGLTQEQFVIYKGEKSLTLRLPNKTAAHTTNKDFVKNKCIDKCSANTRAVCNLHQHASGPSVCSMDIQLSTGCCEWIFMEASNTWGGYRNHWHIGQSPFLYFLYWRCFSLCSFIILGEVKYPYTRFVLLLFKLLLNLVQVHVVFSNYASSPVFIYT